jgi:hypothetical protein
MEDQIVPQRVMQFDMSELPPQFDEELPEQLPPKMETPMSEEQMLEAEELYSLATGASVRLGGFWSPTIFEGAAKSVIESVKNEDEDVRRATLIEAASNPNISVGARVELVKALSNQSRVDMNMVERSAMTRLAESEVAALPSDMANDLINSAMGAVESVPNNAIPEYGAAVGATDPVSLSGYGISEELRGIIAASEKQAGFTDVMGQITPFKYQALTAEIAGVLGYGETDFSTGAAFSWVAQGSALRNMAKMLELEGIEAGVVPNVNGKLGEGTQEAKIAFRAKVRGVIDVLKSNSGVFSDVNHATIPYFLENLFPALITDEYANTGFEEARDNQYKDQLFERARVLRARIAAETTDLGVSEAGLAAQAELTKVEAEQRAFALDSFRPDVFGERISLNEFFGNMSSIDDLALAPDFYRMFRGGYRLLKNRIVRANAAAPSTVANATASTLATGEINRITVGNDTADLLDSTLPPVPERSWVNTNINAAVVLDEADEALALEAGGITNRVILNDKERADALQSVSQRLGSNAVARPAALQLGNSTIAPKIVNGEDGIEVVGVFGRTEVDAFPTMEDAERAARQLFGSTAAVKILTYTGDDAGKLVAATANEAGGKYYFSARAEVPYETVTDVNRWLAFGDKAITPGWANRLWWSTVGKTFQPTTNKSSVFDRFWTLAINPADDKSRSLSRILATRFKEAAKAAGSKGFEFDQLVRAFENKAGKVTRADLDEAATKAGFVMDDNLEKAFRLFRSGTDIMYVVADRYATRLKMMAGDEEIWGATGRIGFGQRVGEFSGKRVVYNTATDAVETLDAAEFAALQGKGAVLMRVTDGPSVGADFVLVQGKGSVRPLSGSGAIKYIPGYIPEVYNSPWIVVGLKNGERAMFGAAANKLDAERLAETLRKSAATKGYTISAVMDRSLQNYENAALAASNLRENMGGVIFGERSANKVLNGSPDINPEIRLDPLSAALRAADAASYTMTKGDMLRQLSQRVANGIEAATGKKVGLLTDDVIQELRGGGIVEQRLADQAAAVLAQARVANGMADPLNTATEMFFSRLESGFANAAAYIANKQSNASSKLLRTKLASGVAQGLTNKLRFSASVAADQAASGGWNVLNGIMRLSHVATVSSAVTMQLALQFFQPLLLAGLAPGSLAKAYAVQMGLISTFAGRRFGLESKRLDAVGRAAGLDKGELSLLLKRMETNGIFDAVEMDTRIKAFAQNAAKAHALRRAEMHKSQVMGGAGRRRLVKLKNVFATGGEAAMRTAERAFIESEYINQQITFLALYMKDKSLGKANLNSRRYVDELAGKVREITGSMTPENSFGFQRGLFKTMFQFISFPWKMTKLVTPEFAGGVRWLSPSEKRGMLAGQFLLYGAVGIPFGDKMLGMMNDAVMSDMPTDPEERSAFERAWMSPEVQGFVNGLLVETAINEVIKNISNSDETYLEISERFAPLGGASFALDSLLAPLLNPSLKSTADLFFNIPGVKASQVGEVIGDAMNLAMADMNNIEDIDYGTRFEYVVNQGLVTMVAQYRREYLLRVHDNLGGHVMRGGNVSQETMTEYERFAFRFLGVDSKNRAEYFKLREQYRDLLINRDASDKEQEAQEYTDRYFEQLLTFNRMRHEEGLPIDRIRDLQNDWIEKQTYLRSVIFEDDPAMMERVGELMADRVLKIIADTEAGTATPVEAKLVENIIQSWRTGVMGDHRQTVNRLLNTAALTPAQKAMVLEAYETYVAEGEP